MGQAFEVTEHDHRPEVVRQVLDLVPDVDVGRRRLGKRSMIPSSSVVRPTADGPESARARAETRRATPWSQSAIDSRFRTVPALRTRTRNVA